MQPLKRFILFASCLFFLKSYSQTNGSNTTTNVVSVKSYLVIRAFKHAPTHVKINIHQELDIDGGSSKIITVDPGYYNISLSDNDGFKYDTSLTVLDPTDVLKKTKQSSVRYLVNPPEKPKVVIPKKIIEPKKTVEPKKEEKVVVNNNSQLATDIENTKNNLLYAANEFEAYKLKKEKEFSAIDKGILKGTAEELTKTKSLFQLKSEATIFITTLKNDIQQDETKLNTKINEYNATNDKLQKLKPDTEANTKLFLKMAEARQLIVKCRDVQTEIKRILTAAELLFPPRIQGIKPMSESLEVALVYGRTEDYKFFVTPQNINNIKVNFKNIINYLVDAKANYETFFYFIQQGLDVNDFTSFIVGEGNIYATPILKACIAELDINVIELFLKNGAKLYPKLIFPERKKSNTQYLYNKIKNNNPLLILFIKYGFTFK